MKATYFIYTNKIHFKAFIMASPKQDKVISEDKLN